MTRPARPSLPACGRPGSRARRTAAALALLLAAPVLLPSPAAGSTPATTVATTGQTAAAARKADATPLRVSIENLAPATIPRTGPVTITGTITNRSEDTWTNLKAYLLVSDGPLRSREELADAAATDPETEVGQRRTTEGLYDEVGDLAPGQTTGYRVSVPRRDLGITGEPGVYWVGVHVLGDGVDGAPGRDTVADGRARTFMPLLSARVARRGLSTRLALVVPVKQEVRRGAAGRLLQVGAWQRSVATDGRLDRLLSLSGRATRPITWVVDPAVLDAVQSVARDNPKLDPGPSGTSPEVSASPDASASPSPSLPGTADEDGDVGPAAEPSAAAVAARSWLEEFRRQASTHRVATVPYGDLDVAAVLDSTARRVFRQATELSAAAMAAQGVDGTSSVVDPTPGFLPGAALRRVDPGTTVLLRDEAYPDADTPVLRHTGRAPVVLTDSAAGNGGPRPNSRYAALAVRQRILSEAALHLMTGPKVRDRPLVVSTPPYWNPGSAWNQSDFFTGLDQPWLRMVDLPTVVASQAEASTALPAPTYPRADREDRISLANMLATQALTTAGTTYAGLLADNDTVDDFLARVALLASSTSARGNPLALAQTQSTLDYVGAQMGEVHVEGPPFVMMSSQDGPVQVTLVNDLDQPVTVGVAAKSAVPGSGTPDLRITAPDPVRLAPGQRYPVRLTVRSDDIGVHAVTIVATNADGTPTGSETQFSVRTSHVGTVIWVITGLGGAVLLLAIVVRLVRRVRRRQSTPGPLLPRQDNTRPPGVPTKPTPPTTDQEVGA